MVKAFDAGRLETVEHAENNYGALRFILTTNLDWCPHSPQVLECFVLTACGETHVTDEGPAQASSWLSYRGLPMEDARRIVRKAMGETE